MDLYGLNKDMLVKLVTTIQDDSKPEKLEDDDLETTIFKYVNELFKRRSKHIKEFLSKDYSKEIIDDITMFNLVKGMLIFGVRPLKFYFQILLSPYLAIGIHDISGVLIYSYKKGIPGVLPPTERRAPDFDYETYSKYIDFVKLLDENNVLLKIMNYLEIFSKDKLE
jgi:hypothetical protein